MKAFPCRRGLSVLIAMIGFFFAAHAERLPDHILDYPIKVEDYPGRMNSEMDRVIRRNWEMLRDHGFEPYTVYWGDFLANPVGGRGQAGAWAQLLIFGGQFDLEKIFGWEGGFFAASFMNATGTNLGHTIGNIFDPSQAIAINSFGLNKMYFEQDLLDERVQIRLGLFSAGNVFASLPVMGLPVSGAVNGNPFSLFTNMSGFHSVGKPSWAFYAKVKPTTSTYTQAAVFQVNPRSGIAGYHGMNFSIKSGDGVLIMTETGWTPTFGDPRAGFLGIYMAGAYLQNYPEERFDGSGTVSNVYGFYFQGQQKVWRSASNENMHLTLWGGITASPQSEVALLPVMSYGGTVLQGLLPGRPDDKLLLNTYLGGVSDSFANQSVRNGKGRPTVETVVEASYIIQISDNLQFQPDIQWIIQPGGYQNVPNAFVLGFQVAAIF